VNVLEQQVADIEKQIAESEREAENAERSADVVDVSTDQLVAKADNAPITDDKPAIRDIDDRETSADSDEEVIDNDDDQELESDDNDFEQDEQIDNESKSNSDWARHRTEKKELERKLNELQAQMARQEGYLAAQAEAQAAAQAQREQEEKLRMDPEPDPEMDFEEHLKWQLRQQKARVDSLENSYKESSTSSNIAMKKQQIQMQTDVFSRQNQDFDEAINYLREKKFNEIRVAYPSASDDQIVEHILKEEEEVAMDLVNGSGGINPAQVFYERAKNYGYQSSQQSNEVSPKVQQLKTINKNKRKSGSLNGVSSSGKTSLDSEQIVNSAIGNLDSLTADEWAAAERDSLSRYTR
jgi:hypothetical protein